MGNQGSFVNGLHEIREIIRVLKTVYNTRMTREKGICSGVGVALGFHKILIET